MGQAGGANRIILAIVAAGVLIAIGLSIGLAIGLRDCDEDERIIVVTATSTTTAAPPQPTFKSAHGTFPYAGVATDAEACSKIGRDIMARKGGNAADAAVAASICTGLINMHSNGIGGGSFYTIYTRANQEVKVLDSREEAPLAATKDMYVNNTDLSVNGGLAAGVPGETLGWYEMQQKKGRLAWKDVIMPSVRLLEEGFPFSEAAHKVAVSNQDKLKQMGGFEMLFDPVTHEVLPVKATIKMPKLARTLRIVAEQGAAAFYDGPLSQDIVDDITERGGIITVDDLKAYKPNWKDPVTLDLGGRLKVHSVPPPGSGAVIEYILNILQGYNWTSSSMSESNRVLTYHRIIEAMKFAYAKRSELGDEEFVNVTELIQNMTSLDFAADIRHKITDETTQNVSYYEPSFTSTEDAGTTHICAVDGEGNAVAVTSTINYYFGSKVIGNRTGIIFNNEMDDFATPGLINLYGVPPSPTNFIEPGKRPQSSMSPTIVVDENGDVVMVTGAAGGTKITTQAAMSIMNTLWFGKSIEEALDMPRLHHQLVPNKVDAEALFPQDIRKGLEAKGHQFETKDPIAIIHAIHVTDQGISPVSDYRKGGAPAGY